MSLFGKLKTTKFKSLKYGDDSFGGGDSLEPIIQKPIRNDNPVGVQTPIQDVALENEKRISVLLNKTNRGYKFIRNQQSLQLSNTRLEATPDNISKRTRISPLIYYNPGNTLAQIGRNPADQGEHYTRFGVTPFMDENLKYSSVVTRNNQENNNRLEKLYNKLQVGTIPTTVNDLFKDRLRNTLNSIARGTNLLAGIFNIFGGNRIINKINSKVNLITNSILPALTPESRIIDEYNGGPGSLYGVVGTTKIRRFDYTNQVDINKFKQFVKDKINSRKNLITGFGNRPNPEQTKLGTSVLYGNDVTAGYENKDEIKNSVYNITSDINGNKIYDDIINKSKGMSSGTYTEYLGTNETTTGYRYVYAKKLSKNIKNPDGRPSWINSKLNVYNDVTIDDRMPVKFNLINAFTGNINNVVEFSAYINGFRDSSTPEYSDIKYIGRSEHFYVYNGFKRDVSFNLQVPCFNLYELREKHKNLATLMASTMGQYDDTKLGGVLCKLTLGNYINNQAGYITSLSYDIPDDSPWDWEKGLAHNLNVSIGFTLIHNFLPNLNNSERIFSLGKPITNKRLPDGNPSTELAIAQQVLSNNFRNTLNSFSSVGDNKLFNQLPPVDQIKEAKKKQPGGLIVTQPKPLPVELSAIPKIDIKRPF
jgi:hypothetical protein